MECFYYNTPLVKGSTNKCYIYNSNGDVIGYFQRYFKSILYRIIDSVIGRNNLFINIKATDSRNLMTIDASVNIKMIKRPTYTINLVDHQQKENIFYAVQINNTTLSPEFSIQNEETTIISKKDMFDSVRFYENREEIALWHFKMKNNLHTDIKVRKNASIKSPIFYALLGHMFYVVGY